MTFPKMTNFTFKILSETNNYQNSDKKQKPPKKQSSEHEKDGLR